MAPSLDLEAHEGLSLAEIEKPDGILETVQEFQLHWQLRDFLDGNKKKEENDPEPDTLYIEEDFQDPEPVCVAFDANPI